MRVPPWVCEYLRPAAQQPEQSSRLSEQEVTIPVNPAMGIGAEDDIGTSQM